MQASAIDDVAAATAFSGAVRVQRGDAIEFERAYGWAHRALEVPNRIDTRFGIASGAKGFTALTVMSLVEDGALTLDTTARSILGDDLPLIADDVTVRHLLAHRSGIGDYLDEDAHPDITEHVLTVAPHRLVTTEDYLLVLDGFPTKFPAGERFEYCNGGFVVLALLAERAAGVPFHDLMRDRVFRPAGLVDTAYLRSDALPGRAALGYLTAAEDSRSNLLHLPVLGSGDGGLYTTLDDVQRLWEAMFGGRIVPMARVADMVRAHSVMTEERYGLGFWLHASLDVVRLEGYDAGVSFRSWHDPADNLTCTMVANWSDGVWPMCRELETQLGLRTE
jgi:CubicO group peptidase (beta-lactamase class C family)